MEGKMVDLSFPLEDGMMTYPTTSHTRFESAIKGRVAIEGRKTRKFTMGSHTGTHIDAIDHFVSEGQTVDEISLDKLIGSAYLLNLGILEPKTVIEPFDIEPLIKGKKIHRLVLQTEWSRFWNTDQYYKDWPFLSQACAQFIVDQEIQVLAMDFPSPDAVYKKGKSAIDSPNHKLFFKNEIILVEYLTNLNALEPGDIFLMALPLKLKNFDGAPARVAAYSMNK